MNLSKSQKITMTALAVISIVSTIVVMQLSVRDQNIATLGSMSMGGILMVVIALGNPEKKKAAK